MAIRVVCFVGLATLAVACVRSPRTEVMAPAPVPRMPAVSTLVLPTVDSATYASLGALLERLQQQSGLLTELTSRSPRMYALFRELEGVQAKLDTLLSATDTEGRTLYDRLARMTTRSDSLFRLLDQLNRQSPRP
jgi:hypothetical protein